MPGRPPASCMRAAVRTCAWLCGPPVVARSIRSLDCRTIGACPARIGDVAWAVRKIRSLICRLTGVVALQDRIGEATLRQFGVGDRGAGTPWRSCCCCCEDAPRSGEAVRCKTVEAAPPHAGEAAAAAAAAAEADAAARAAVAAADAVIGTGASTSGTDTLRPSTPLAAAVAVAMAAVEPRDAKATPAGAVAAEVGAATPTTVGEYRDLLRRASWSSYWRLAITSEGLSSTV